MTLDPSVTIAVVRRHPRGLNFGLGFWLTSGSSWQDHGRSHSDENDRASEPPLGGQNEAMPGTRARY